MTNQPFDKSPEAIHPIAQEIRHDDETMALFKLASDIAHASRIPSYSENQPNPYDAFLGVMYNYVGDPDPAKRVGIHELPGAHRDTRRGPRTYSIGYVNSLDPTTGELCIIRKDPHVDATDTTGWMVMTYNLRTGSLREEIVLSAVPATPTQREHSMTLEIVARASHHGPHQLTFSLEDNVGPAHLSHKKYYGRGTGPVPESMPDAAFTTDIGILYQMIAFERSQLQSTLEPEPANNLNVSIGHVALND